MNKLFIVPSARYSEDIDFVQKRPEPIGETLNAIRNVLDPCIREEKGEIYSIYGLYFLSSSRQKNNKLHTDARTGKRKKTG